MARRAATATARSPAQRRTSRTRPVRRASGPSVRGGVVALPGRLLPAPFRRGARARGGQLLDALLRGQGWIALVGVLLVGIVFFNVDLLQLNRNIAGTTSRSAEVRRENARLRLQLARLASTERIQKAAADRGLVLPAPGDVRYLRARPGVDGRHAARRVTAPKDGAVAEAQPSEPQQPAPAAPTAGTPVAQQPPGTQPTAGAAPQAQTAPAAPQPQVAQPAPAAPQATPGAGAPAR
jgi:cell division protein FtsL